jgi:hypothetical protein
LVTEEDRFRIWRRVVTVFGRRTVSRRSGSRNGSIIMFGAREQGFGRGLDEIDGEVFDEAQILTLRRLRTWCRRPTRRKHPTVRLVFFLGTPPRADRSGESFTAKRERAINGRLDRPDVRRVLRRPRR